MVANFHRDIAGDGAHIQSARTGSEPTRDPLVRLCFILQLDGAGDHAAQRGERNPCVATIAKSDHGVATHGANVHASRDRYIDIRRDIARYRFDRNDLTVTRCQPDVTIRRARIDIPRHPGQLHITRFVLDGERGRAAVFDGDARVVGRNFYQAVETAKFNDSGSTGNPSGRPGVMNSHIARFHPYFHRHRIRN